ncbi:hypothetical protein C8R46DRAFT_1214015 [Mycena filopes]|nr:hypothetical protein C8R46DRAFT_1214015 [Mycena filopes]
MNTSGLSGSSRQNPWIFGPTGGLVLAKPPPAVHPVTGLRLVIFKGPPSEIRQDQPPRMPLRAWQNSPPRRGADAARPATPNSENSPPRPGIDTVRPAASGPQRASTANRRVRQTARMSTGGCMPRRIPTPELNIPAHQGRRSRRIGTSTSSAATRIVSVVGPIVDGCHAVGGSRADRDAALTEAELWLDDRRPPSLDNPQAHHVCAVCKSLKSHPVTIGCGHSYCYVCLRLWIEKSWSCPHCNAFITKEPFRHWSEEESIRASHPEWDDQSGVPFTWDGLVFPKRRRLRSLSP